MLEVENLARIAGTKVKAARECVGCLFAFVLCDARSLA